MAEKTINESALTRYSDFKGILLQQLSGLTPTVREICKNKMVSFERKYSHEISEISQANLLIADNSSTTEIEIKEKYITIYKELQKICVEIEELNSKDKILRCAFSNIGACKSENYSNISLCIPNIGEIKINFR